MDFCVKYIRMWKGHILNIEDMLSLSCVYTVENTGNCLWGHFEVCTYRPTRNMQRPVSRNAMRIPTHMSVENGDSRLKVFSLEAKSLCRMKLIPVCMKGVVMSTTCSLVAVTVSGATARSAS